LHHVELAVIIGAGNNSRRYNDHISNDERTTVRLAVKYPDKAVTRIVWTSEDEVTGVLCATIAGDAREHVYEDVPLNVVLNIINKQNTDLAFMNRICDNDAYQYYTIDWQSYAGSFD
jgi:hypothetical protein